VVLLSADGALEAAPAMGAADIILDLVSTGVTLRENNLKTVAGGDILQVLVSGVLNGSDTMPVLEFWTFNLACKH
jgi:ATP phosphoribosyltransferase